MDNKNIVWLEKDMFMKNLVVFDGFSVDYIEILPGAIEESVVHTQCDEWIYVLEGQLLFNLNDSVFLLKTGEFVNIPRNTIHGSVNESKDNVKLLSVCNPPFELDFMTKVKKQNDA